MTFLPHPPAMMTEHGNRYFRNLHLTQQLNLHFNTHNIRKHTYLLKSPTHSRTPNAPSLLVFPALFRSSIEQQQSSDGA
ncbi:hypothetical protein N7445_003846 [Penicillium cf. griseofulvum]|nr:hypothetical protein N7445_003846 [Penicillium cf. griseofulvum]